MNKKVIISLTLSFFFISFLIFSYHFLYKKQSLEVKSEKEEEESEEKEEEEEEITDIPWTYTWKGEVCSLSICIIASLIIGFVISYGYVKGAFFRKAC